MRYSTKAFVCIICSALFISCQPSASGDEEETTTVWSSDEIPAERESVKKEPVAEFEEAVGDGLNDWRFSAKLYETKERFRFLLDMKYQEVTASDTIRFPNFGMEPQPKIRKGDNQQECIVGFLDDEGNFKEYVKVYVADGDLRLKTLKHYAVVPKE